MKKTLALVILLLLIGSCQKADNHKYKLKAGNFTILRSTNIAIDGNKLQTCLKDYKYSGGKVTLYDYYNNVISMEVLYQGINEHYIRSTILIGKNNKSTDDRFVPLFDDRGYRHGVSSLVCFRQLPGIEDIALVPSMKEWWDVGAQIIFANVQIAIHINSTEAKSPNYNSDLNNIDAIFKLHNKMYADYINDFYPYFRKCAEQAKVPVNPESIK